MYKNLKYVAGFEQKIRNKPVASSIEKLVSQGIKILYGTQAYGVWYSGGQDAKGFGNRRTGSERHDIVTNRNNPDFGKGRAGDLYVFNGKHEKITGVNLARLGQWWLANGHGSAGLEMKKGGIHLDNWKQPRMINGALSWTYAYSNSKDWGATVKQMLLDGRRGIQPKKTISISENSEPIKPNEFVRAIQKLLIAQGYDLKADGFEGPKTEDAILDWQERNSFTPNGTISNDQLAKLRIGPVNPKPIMKSRGVRGAGGATIGSGGLVLTELNNLSNKVEQQQQALSSGEFLPLIISLIILAGSVYALYARLDDAGKLDFIKRKK